MTYKNNKIKKIMLENIYLIKEDKEYLDFYFGNFNNYENNFNFISNNVLLFCTVKIRLPSEW